MALSLLEEEPQFLKTQAKATGIDEVRAELLPEQKVAAIEDLVRQHGAVAMVGVTLSFDEGARVVIVDIGVASDIDSQPGLVTRKIARGTQNKKAIRLDGLNVRLLVLALVGGTGIEPVTPAV